MEFMFGEGQLGIVVAVFLVLALIGVLAWLVRVFRSTRTGAASRHARQPRLAVIDAAALDGRRHLVLIRRDNVEHLLMIGGRTDIVVEPNIVRATAREPALARPPAFAEQLEATPTVSTQPRPQRQLPMAEEPVSQHADVEPLVPLAPRQPRPVDRLAADQPARETAPRASREPQLPGAAAETMFTPAVEHNSAEAAQRLVEAVLLRRRQPRSDLTPSPESQPEADAERESVEAAGLARREARLDREGKMASPRPSSVYNSLEQNMADLFGRPDKIA
jgi:hypothetical protein